ncbi:unnamed protein product [Periconia digitata]|uniref:Uncharacterized protein n=1 Tax=Periconia digitata TaxID=1303443 RepID=A0A9W4XUJ8_9PLEO|nr:unnamed protein product [Periconia digitata]
MTNLTSDERESLLHHSVYGRKGERPTERFNPIEGWEKHAMTKPITSEWNQPVPRTELVKLLNGFQPREMEDKWLVYADGPDAQGNASVYMYRSWTHYLNLELKLVINLDENGEFAEDNHRFTEIIWESDHERARQQEEQAKETAKKVCEWCMDVRLP